MVKVPINKSMSCIYGFLIIFNFNISKEETGKDKEIKYSIDKDFI